MNFIRIDQNDSNYPEALSRYLGEHAPKTVTAMGNLDILHNRKLGVCSSVKCPGAIILKTYDLMRKIRETGVTVISGFHSPMERECLNILLKGRQPVIICPARSIEGMRIKTEYEKPLDEGRLLFLSPFTGKERRISSERALFRNQFVGSIADVIVIPYTAPNGKTEQFCKELLTWNKPIYTLQTESNANLIALGLEPITQENLTKNLRSTHD